MSVSATAIFDFARSVGSVKSAMFVSLLSVWVLIGLFTYLNRYTKRRYFSMWTVAWLFYALWLSLNYFALDSRENAWVLMAKQWCLGVAATFLLWGSVRFLRIRVRERLLALFLGFLLAWSYSGAFYDVQRLYIELPVFGLIGAASVVASVSFFRYRTRKQFIGATLLGVGFFLWGGYYAAYPLFQMTEALSSSGFFISAVLQIFIAVSMIILVLEEVRHANQTAIQHIRTQKSRNSELKVKVRSTEERYRSLFNQASEAIIITSQSNLRLLEVNETALRLLGLARAEALQRHLPTVCRAAHPACIAPAAPNDWFHWATRQPQLLLVQKTGGTTVTEVEAAPVDFDGVLAYQFFFREVTERARLQQQLRQAEKLAALGQMMSGVAHELNNPLAVVRGYLEVVLKRDVLPPEARADLLKIQQESGRAAKLVKNFLSFAREQAPHRQTVHLNDLVDQLVDLRKLDLRQAKIETLLNLASDLPTTEADPDQLLQIVNNLVTNSIQALQKHAGLKRIKLSSTHTGGEIILRVEDSGPGVPPELEQKIFEPFFTTKEVGVGTGLGLSIAHSIMVEHNGKIRYERSPLGGAAFVLHLPVVNAGPQATGKEVPTKKERERTTPSVRILVVDDELALAELLCDMLRMLGHQPTFCLNPIAALELMNQRNFDIILSDFRMPSMTGQEFYRAACRHNRDLSRRIIFITGEVITEETAEFLQSSGCPHLEKPFQISDLADLIARRLEQDAIRVTE